MPANCLPSPDLLEWFAPMQRCAGTTLNQPPQERSLWSRRLDAGRQVVRSYRHFRAKIGHRCAGCRRVCLAPQPATGTELHRCLPLSVSRTAGIAHFGRMSLFPHAALGIPKKGFQRRGSGQPVRGWLRTGPRRR